MVSNKSVPEKLIVIGASAGGLKPLQELIKHLKLDKKTSVVIALHLSADHRSYLPEIIAKSTKNEVLIAEDKTELKPSCIYVAPPDGHIEIKDMRFQSIKDDTLPSPNINILFESAAKLDSTMVCGVLLSGTGFDGTKGLLTIKTQSGLSFVQNPSSADYTNMLQSAIDHEAADFVLEPAEIGKALSLIIKKNQFANIEDQVEQELDKNRINDVLDYLNVERQIDLKNYKESTLRRRIYRRVALCGYTNVDQYLFFLKQNTDELESLINDIFISVTQFFRDAPVWKVLEVQIVEYIRKGLSGRLLRVWSAGCSTGEEAYTWAIFLQKIKIEHRIEFDYIIFATDISERSIEHARRGIYDISSIDVLDKDVIDRYFKQVTIGYQVIRHLRDKIVFSVHNFLLDPPFSNMDLLSCRNVLIYFNQKLQNRALTNFAYALNKGGILSLGTSESIGLKQSYFSELSKEQKVFRRTQTVSKHNILNHPIKKVTTKKPISQQPKTYENDLKRLIETQLALLSGHSALLIDENDNILYAYGNTELLITIQSGRFTQNIFDHIDQKFRATLRALILKSRRVKKTITHYEILSENRQILFSISPVNESEQWLIISVREETIANLNFNTLGTEKVSDAKLVHELESELNATKQTLQTVVEELEQTNEALQSSNEELQSSNEELQSTNEELQTTNEELQSSNEELRTLNEELQNKNSELDVISTHLQSVEENLETPYVLLSYDNRVLRCSKTIDLVSQSEHLHLNDYLENLQWITPDDTLQSELLASVNQVKQDRSPRMVTGVKINQERYDIAIKHYSEKQERFNEIMLIFTKVTRRFKLAEQALGNFKKREEVLNLLETGVIFTDNNGIIKYFNPEAGKFLSHTSSTLVGEHIDKVLYVYTSVEAQFPEPGLFQKMTDINFGFKGFGQHSLLIKREIGNRNIRLQAVPSKNRKEVTSWLFEIRDISNEVELNSRIEYSASHDPLTGLSNRLALDDRIQRILSQVEAVDSMVYALIDIDNFKPINDIAGHKQGDLALKQITLEIMNCLRKNDLLARIGGDEFVLLLVNITEVEALHVLENIVQKMDELDISTDEGLFNISASIGWTYLTQTAQLITSDLYSHADEAMYEAKKSGGNTIKKFNVDGQLTAHSITALTFEKVKFAFKHGLFQFAFQPIVNLRNKNKFYFEMLIRIEDEGELMSPYQFMSVIERYNYTRQFDKKVFYHALYTINEIRKKTKVDLTFAINLSATALDYRDVFEIIAEFPQLIGNKKVKLVFEITETAAIQDVVSAKRFIERVHNLGIKVALDDFGVGFNGYHYLKQLPVDTVKVDGSFIQGLIDNDIDKIFVNSVIALSKILNFSTVAEFVDTDEKLKMVKKLGFTDSQGYLHAKPMNQSELLYYIETKS